MTPTEITAYVAAADTLVLVTTGSDGVPDPVPMWFVTPDGEIRMRTYAASQKVVNLRRDPRVSGLIADGNRYDELRGVQLTGRITLVDDPEWIADVVIGLRIKYEGLAPGEAASVRSGVLAAVNKQIGLRFDVDRTVSWDHRKLRAAPAPR